jgi:sugar lactone lactonase YvrE
LRVELSHFAPWGFNWPFIPQGDATVSQAEGQATVDQQALHEDIPIPGTDITLHYASNRVQGYQTLIHVPVSGDTVPVGLNRIEVRVEVAGRSIEQVLDPLPNQAADIEWDGLDHLGRQAQGPLFAHVKIGFVYDGVYLGAEGDFHRSFAQTGNETPTGILTRQEVIYWKNDKIQVLSAKGTNTVADGWTLSVHHKLHPVDPTSLFKGDGTIIRNNTLIIDTVAGNGNPGDSGDGGPATDSVLNTPESVAVDKEGNFYIADQNNGRIRMVDTSGTITTVAGGGTLTVDGVPATDAQLSTPYGVAVDNKGNLFISDSGNYRIRKVDSSGIITTVAGNGVSEYSGDNGPAIDASLVLPSNITTDNQGNLYIVDQNRIRKVDPGGIITTVAGSGNALHSGDDGPAIDAQIRGPYDVAVDSLGNLYISEYLWYTIRKIDTSGIITTIAGDGGSWGSGGDGGPATEARLSMPTGIATDSTGNLYFVDSYNLRVRKIDTHGIITTVAGGGSSGDGGSATEAALSFLTYGLAIDSQDSIYMATYNSIRKVAPQFFIDRYSADGGEILFTEGNNLSHTMSGSGRHIQTVALDTGTILHEFGYDAENQLISITDDQFGNISINRDAAGIPISVVSSGGLTTLVIDDSNHLVEITDPDLGTYIFEYTPDGLMTDRIDP